MRLGQPVNRSMLAYPSQSFRCSYRFPSFMCPCRGRQPAFSLPTEELSARWERLVPELNYNSKWIRFRRMIQAVLISSLFLRVSALISPYGTKGTSVVAFRSPGALEMARY
jgi:hypothetical protein